MSEIKCLVCGGKHFVKGEYELDISVDIYSYGKDNSGVNVSVDSEAETTEKLNFVVGYNDETVYKYVCEDCGFIMSFISEKDVESRSEESKRKKKENTYDWTNFKEKK